LYIKEVDNFRVVCRRRLSDPVVLSTKKCEIGIEAQVKDW
jgi:hypothetical protein